MIHATFGTAKLDGSKTVLLSELSVIASAFKNAEIKKEKVIEAVEIGFMSDEELDKKIKEKEKELLKKLFGIAE